ncbi:MAG: hypothetical protein WBF22_06190 [Methylocella sp.]
MTSQAAIDDQEDFAPGALVIGRFRNSMKTSALTLPLPMIMNRTWPRE